MALDAFQTIILPRRPTGRFQLTRIFFIATWAPWVVMAERARNKKVREQIYSIYGPAFAVVAAVVVGASADLWLCDVLFLHGLSLWRPMLLHTGAVRGRGLALISMSAERHCLRWGWAMLCRTAGSRERFIILESGVGLGFVALVIGYLPVLIRRFRVARSASRCSIRVPARRRLLPSCSGVTLSRAGKTP